MGGYFEGRACILSVRWRDKGVGQGWGGGHLGHWEGSEPGAPSSCPSLACGMVRPWLSHTLSTSWFHFQRNEDNDHNNSVYCGLAPASGTLGQSNACIRVLPLGSQGLVEKDPSPPVLCVRHRWVLMKPQVHQKALPIAVWGGGSCWCPSSGFRAPQPPYCCPCSQKEGLINKRTSSSNPHRASLCR